MESPYHGFDSDNTTDSSDDDFMLQQKKSRKCWTRCCEKYNRTMKPRDALQMTAYQKWKYYRRPPWKFFLNIILLILTTMQILKTNSSLSSYTQANNDNFEFLLAPESYTDGLYHPKEIEIGTDRLHYIYQADGLVNSINHTTYLYYNIHNITVDYYDYLNTTNIPPIEMIMINYKQGIDIFNDQIPYTGETVVTSYNLTNEYDCGPFNKFKNNKEELYNYIHTIKSIKLKFILRNYELSMNNNDKNNLSRVCFQWLTESRYNFVNRGRIEYTIDSYSSFCPTHDTDLSTHPFHFQAYLFVAIVIFASIHEILILKSLLYQIKVFTIVRNHNTRLTVNNDHEILHWELLSWSEKMAFFNIWFILGTISNTCNIVGYCLSFHEYLTYERVEFDITTQVLIASGCLLIWISMVQYLEGFSTYYVLITTLSRSLPKVASFLVGVLPIFLGYCLFGIAFFGLHSKNFQNMDSATVTLFSLLNGDSISDIFYELYVINPIISRVYIISFITLFIYAVLNIFIAIVEDAFASKAFELQKKIRKDNQSDKYKNNNGTPKKYRRKSRAETEVLNFIDFSPIRGAKPAKSRTSLNNNNNNNNNKPLSPRNTFLKTRSSRGIISYRANTEPQLQQEDYKINTNSQSLDRQQQQQDNDLNIKSSISP